MKGILVLDVCGTLFNEDTTIGLLAHHFRTSRFPRWRYWTLVILSERWSPAFYVLTVLEALFARHLLKLLLVRMLRGDRVPVLESSAAQYAERLLRDEKIAPVWELINGQPDDYTWVLASSSLRPVVEALSRKLDVTFVASELEASDNLLTGRYSRDISGKKPEALQAVFGVPGTDWHYIAVSDNPGDRGLLENAEHAVVVVHKKRHLRRWDGFPATYIRLY